MLPAVGCVTASANAVATAASIALPPLLMTWNPIWEAMSLCVITIPRRARCGVEPACERERGRSARAAIEDEKDDGGSWSLRRRFYQDVANRPTGNHR